MRDGVDLRTFEETLRETPTGHIITDCKSLYDAVARSESLALGLTDRQSSIEVAATRQQIQATDVETHWVNSERQLADVLTKSMAADNLKKWLRTGQWKIVFDKNFTSAKKVKKARKNAHFTQQQNPKRQKTSIPNTTDHYTFSDSD